MTRPKYTAIGRPPGKSTMYWTDAEREIVRKAYNKLIEELPHRTPRAIVSVMLRIESGEI